MSDLSGLIKVVAGFAPTLGTLLLGPAGTIIGAGIAHEFGGSISDPDALAASISANPNAAQILDDFKIKAAQINAGEKARDEQNQETMEQAEVSDQASARQREVQVANSAHPDYVMRNLAYMQTIGFFVCFASLLIFKPAQDVLNILLVMIGVLATNNSTVIGYYFGSAIDKAKKYISNFINKKSSEDQS